MTHVHNSLMQQTQSNQQPIAHNFAWIRNSYKEWFLKYAVALQNLEETQTSTLAISMHEDRSPWGAFIT